MGNRPTEAEIPLRNEKPTSRAAENKPSARRTPTAATATGLAVAVLVALLPFARFFEAVERSTQDLRFHLRGSIKPRAKIVIAALDVKSEAAWNDQPVVFWTGHYADLIRNARAAGARVVAFDVIPQVSGQRYLEAREGRAHRGGPDTQFADAVENAGDGSLVFAQIIAPPGETSESSEERAVRPAAMYLHIPEFADNLAFADFPATPDGVIRETFTRKGAEDGGTPLPSFSETIAERMAAGNPKALRRFAVSRRLEDMPTFYIDYSETAFPSVSAVDVANGTLSPANRLALRDAAVLVGWTAPDTGDWHIGSQGRVLAGVVVQAEAVATLLDGRVVHRLGTAAEAWLTLILGCGAVSGTAIWILGSGGKRVGGGRDALVLGAVGFAWLGAAEIFFIEAHIFLPVVAPLAALILPCLTFRAVHAAAEWLRRTRVETQFGRYASPEIRDYVLERPDLQPELRDLSVLFLDIRGSSGYAERHPPETVMRELNEMFEAFDGVLQKHRGLLYRYTGDGFLAVFGAPIPSETHAADAVLCAVDLLDRMRQFNRRRNEAGLERWSVGCSVNSGRAAAGMLGTADRSDYTVIGDVVNLAAKIELKNKNPDGTVFSDLVITESTLARAPGIDKTPRLEPLNSRNEDVIGGRREMVHLRFYRLADTEVGGDAGGGPTVTIGSPVA